MIHRKQIWRKQQLEEKTSESLYVKRSRGAVLLGRPSKIKKVVCDDVSDEDEYQSETSSFSNF